MIMETGYDSNTNTTDFSKTVRLIYFILVDIFEVLNWPIS